MRQDYELVRKAAARLKPLDREVLQLVMWEEMSHDQVARMIGSTGPAVKQRFHRAKRRLAASELTAALDDLPAADLTDLETRVRSLEPRVGSLEQFESEVRGL